MLQPLPKLLLLRRRQTPECLIVLQCPLLLGGWHVFVVPQPIPGMTLRLGGRLCWPARLLRAICRNRMPLRMRRRRMPLLCWMRLRWTRCCRMPLRWMRRWVETAFLGQARDTSVHDGRQTGSRQPSRPVFSQPQPGPFSPPRVFYRLRPVQLESSYGFAVTSCCNSRSSSNSKSEYMSWSASNAFKSFTALPGPASA